MTPEKLRTLWEGFSEGDEEPPRRIVSIYADGCRVVEDFDSAQIDGLRDHDIADHEGEIAVTEWVETAVLTYDPHWRFSEWDEKRK